MAVNVVAGRVGNQTPRIRLVPPSAVDFTEGRDAVDLAAGYGLKADDWQADTIICWHARRADGQLAAGSCGQAVARQNGKNGTVEISQLARMIRGRRQLHTAHEVKTGRKHFLRMLSFFEDEKNYPELAALVTEIRKTNGQEAIFLVTGGSIEFVARSRGSGRGFTVDDLWIDEAQELTDEQLEALKPTISAAPSGDPQTIYLGTPPPPGSPGTVFLRIREAGVLGTDPRLCWLEWSIPDALAAVDAVLDDEYIWDTNPALGMRLGWETILDERRDMSPEGYCRERLGQWPTVNTATAIPADKWNDCKSKDSPSTGRRSYGVDISADRSTLTIAVAVRQDKATEPYHVEIVRQEPTSAGTTWAVEWLKDRWPQTSAVVIDAMSPASGMLPALATAKVKVTLTGANELARASGVFLDKVTGHELRHLDQEQLNAAVKDARKRALGDAGGFTWDRRSKDTDLSPLVGATLAVWGASTSKRRPGRRVRGGVL